MGLGDITATTTAYATMALLNTALDAENTGAATAGADINTFTITSEDNVFYLTKVVRAAS
jgi:hypothetical protein